MLCAGTYPSPLWTGIWAARAPWPHLSHTRPRSPDNQHPQIESTKASHGVASDPRLPDSPGSRDSAVPRFDNSTGERNSEAFQGQQIREKLNSHVGRVWKVTGPQDSYIHNSQQSYLVDSVNCVNFYFLVGALFIGQRKNLFSLLRLDARKQQTSQPTQPPSGPR